MNAAQYEALLLHADLHAELEALRSRMEIIEALRFAKGFSDAEGEWDDGSGRDNSPPRQPA